MDTNFLFFLHSLLSMWPCLGTSDLPSICHLANPSPPWYVPWAPDRVLCPSGSSYFLQLCQHMLCGPYWIHSCALWPQTAQGSFLGKRQVRSVYGVFCWYGVDKWFLGGTLLFTAQVGALTFEAGDGVIASDLSPIELHTPWVPDSFQVHASVLQEENSSSQPPLYSAPPDLSPSSSSCLYFNEELWNSLFPSEFHQIGKSLYQILADTVASWALMAGISLDRYA